MLLALPALFALLAPGLGLCQAEEDERTAKGEAAEEPRQTTTRLCRTDCTGPCIEPGTVHTDLLAVTVSVTIDTE